jgi:hypothetical protein
MQFREFVRGVGLLLCTALSLTLWRLIADWLLCQFSKGGAI